MAGMHDLHGLNMGRDHAKEQCQWIKRVVHGLDCPVIGVADDARPAPPARMFAAAQAAKNSTTQ